MNNLFVQPRTEDLANEKTDLLITLLISHKHPPYKVYVLKSFYVLDIMTKKNCVLVHC